MVLVIVLMPISVVVTALVTATITARFIAQNDRFTHREQEDNEIDNKYGRAQAQLTNEILLGLFPSGSTKEAMDKRILEIVKENVASNDAQLDEMERRGAAKAA